MFLIDLSEKNVKSQKRGISVERKNKYLFGIKGFQTLQKERKSKLLLAFKELVNMEK